jgi:glutamate racemase
LKVGVFDSGLGGLTVLDSILKVLKGSEFYYIADTFYAPYGEKSVDEILARCEKITEFLLETYGIDALVIACNTATSAAIKKLREKFPFLIIIGTEPGIKPALNSTKTNNIAIMATSATLKGTKYKELALELVRNSEVKLYEQACVGLAKAIENGEIDTRKTINMLELWLKPMKKNRVDTIVLGCTHYPLISHNIRKIMGEDIVLIDTGDAIANRLLNLSKNLNHRNSGDIKIDILYTGKINFDMVNIILKNRKFEHRKIDI